MPLEVKLKPVTTTTIKKLPGEAMLERKMGPAVEKWERYASMILLEWKPTWCLGRIQENVSQEEMLCHGSCRMDWTVNKRMQ